MLTQPGVWPATIVCSKLWTGHASLGRAKWLTAAALPPQPRPALACEKMSTREPRLCSLGSSLSSSTILPAGGGGRRGERAAGVFSGGARMHHHGALHGLGQGRLAGASSCALTPRASLHPSAPCCPPPTPPTRILHQVVARDVRRAGLRALEQVAAGGARSREGRGRRWTGSQAGLSKTRCQVLPGGALVAQQWLCPLKASAGAPAHAAASFFLGR